MRSAHIGVPLGTFGLNVVPLLERNTLSISFPFSFPAGAYRATTTKQVFPSVTEITIIEKISSENPIEQAINTSSVIHFFII